MMTDPTYNDDDLVYVDPETRSVVGKVEWDKDDRPKSIPYKSSTGKDHWRRFFPFGSYRSMKKTFRLEGKSKEADSDLSLDEVLPKFFDDAL